MLLNIISKYRRLNRRNVNIFAIILLVLIEEYFIGIARRYYRNSYSNTIYRPINAKRKAAAPNIAILIIIYDNLNEGEYILPQATVSCYATLHNYTLINLNLQQHKDYLAECPGKDFMFQRHCVLVELMKDRPEIEWFLFLDADMGIVNPDHLIEEYIDPKADIIFYDRLYNYEIMAGSYLAKNSQFTHNFLIKWSLYEHKVKPGTFQQKSTDNGAIQEVFLDEFCGSTCSPAERKRCTKIWEESTWYDDLFLHESCARIILGSRNLFQNENGTIKQLSNVDGFYARDGWQTDTRWSTDDFVLHGWKESMRHGLTWASWLSPFSSEDFDPQKCRQRHMAHLNWAYKDSFMRSTDEISNKLHQIFKASYLEHLERAKTFVRKYPLIRPPIDFK